MVNHIASVVPFQQLPEENPPHRMDDDIPALRATLHRLDTFHIKVVCVAAVATDLAFAGAITMFCCQSERCYNASLILEVSALAVAAVGASILCCIRPR
jgi:hypothetical protein